MCEHCTPFATKTFSSQEDFNVFEKALDAKCEDGTFIQIVSSDDTEEMSLQSRYQCTYCNNDWVLSVPEHAYRGYFLETVDTEQEQEQTHDTNRFYHADFSKKSKGNCGCYLGMLFLFVILIVYGIYSLFSFLFDVLF
ncbi:hypothetical protein [Kordia sp.]|uniref:hypothetical protein n=1 Tax=Kordia sp. TaxID=1965332 RepID=UPI003B59DB37